MRKSASLLSAIFILLLLDSTAFVLDAASQNQKNFLWKVQSRTGTVYLLGAIHFLKKEVYPLHRKIETSFDQSDVLVVEANIYDIGKVDLQKLLESGFYPGDETLEKHVSPETYELVRKESGRLGVPLDLIQKQKPWFLALTFQSLELLKLGFDPGYGIDNYFLSKAGGKKILELESLDYQIKLLSGFSGHDQELFLLYTLKDLGSLGEEVDHLIRVWTSGDTKGVESILTKTVMKDKGMSPVYEKLIDQRNREMAARIEDFLRAKETCFVIVGAGHLVGTRGIVELLRRKGYPVEQQ